MTVDYERDPNASRAGRALTGAIVVALLCAASVIFFYRINAPSMWIDEIFARYYGRANFGTMLKSTNPHDLLSYGYYWINQNSMLLFTDIDLAVRTPEACAALLTLLLVYFIARHVYGSGAGIIAMVLLIINSFFVRYAQENRFYQLASMCLCGSYLCYVRYLTYGRWPALIGYTLFVTLFLYVQQFGFVVGAVLVVVAMCLWLLRLLTPTVRTTYSLSGRQLIAILSATVFAGVLWMPIGVRVLRLLMSHQTKGAQYVDSFWAGAVPLTVFQLAQYLMVWVLPYFRYDVICLVGLLTLGVLVNLCNRQGRALVMFGVVALVTLPVLYAMNMSHAAPMPKRFLYLFPITAIGIAGGLCALPALVCSTIERMCGMLAAQWITLRIWLVAATRVLVWLLIIEHIIFPALTRCATEVQEGYYKERQNYKTMALVLKRWLEPNDIIVYTDPTDWPVSEYGLPSIDLWARAVTDTAPTHQNIERKTSSGKRLWLTHMDPRTLGVDAATVVRVPCGNSYHQGTLSLVNPGFSNAPQARATYEENILWDMITNAACPLTLPAEQLTTLLLQRGATGDVRRITEYFCGRFPASAQACSFGYNYLTAIGEVGEARLVWQRYAECYFWDAGAQARVAELAFSEKNYSVAYRFARRWRALRLDGESRPDEIIGIASLALSNYAQAYAYLTCAVKSIARAPRDSADSRVRYAETLRALLACQEHFNDDFAMLESAQNEWVRTLTTNMIQKYAVRLTAMATDTARARRFIRAARIQADAQPCLASLARILALRSNTNALRSALVALRHGLTPEQWLTFSCALSQLAPPAWQHDLIVPWDQMCLDMPAASVRKTSLVVATSGWASETFPLLVCDDSSVTNWQAMFACDVLYGGPYELRATLSAAEPRPFDVFLNGSYILTNVGGWQTGSWDARSAQEKTLGFIILSPGENYITLRQINGLAPGISGIRCFSLLPPCDSRAKDDAAYTDDHTRLARLVAQWASARDLTLTTQISHIIDALASNTQRLTRFTTTACSNAMSSSYAYLARVLMIHDTTNTAVDSMAAWLGVVRAETWPLYAASFEHLTVAAQTAQLRLPYEYFTIAVDARDVRDTTLVCVISGYGTPSCAVLACATADSTNWHAQFPVVALRDGTYRMQAVIAAAEPRAFDILVNGKLALSNAGGNVTGDWHAKAAQSVPLGMISLHAGTNTVRLEDRDRLSPCILKIVFDFMECTQ